MYHSTMYHELMDESSPTKRGAHFTTPSLGELFREARRSAGLSAQSVAEASGLSIDTVRSIESGRTVSPAFTTVARLASVLEMSLDRMSEAAQVDERDS
ncbi:helix-turn-helix domain-containing protein [Actinomyces sp. oral taxon 171]|uniref:helix-turn-helix domain-containing protein n=1 Tax=Actinomyces sp. oral taxon 171 TaxID=706438 RepID=UPI00399FFC80